MSTNIPIEIAPGPFDGLEDEEDEAPGTLDLIAAGDLAMPDWQATIEELTAPMARLGAAVEAFSAAVEVSDRRGGGAAGRLQVAARLAGEMDPPAEEILRLGQRNAAALVKIDSAMQAIFDEIGKATMSSENERATARKFLTDVLDMVAAAGRSTEMLKMMSTSVDQAARYARVLRPSLRKLQAGLRGFMDAQAVYQDWGRRSLAILQELNGSDSPLPAL